MSYESIIIPSRDSYSLDVRIFEAKNPKAVIKIIHGMEEHQNRYVPFAEYLQNEGYTVVTADLRGHGRSAPLLSHIADKNGHKLLNEDEEVIKEYIQKRFPELPLYLFGHSMGSIIARTVIQNHAKDYKKCVLCGYPNANPISGVAIFLTVVLRLFKGPKGYSKLLTDAVLGPFSKAIPNAKTPIDWLSYNEENVNKYDADPLCGEEFTIGSYNALVHLTDLIGKAGKYKKDNLNLPILLISGEDDPCTGGEKGRLSTLNTLQKAGYKDIKVVTYEKMRHEILNEIDNQKVYEEIKNFFDK